MERLPLTEPERVDFLIRNLEAGVAVRFSEKTGIPTTRLSRMKAGELRLIRQVDKILTAYPQVSREWLETGVGYPGDLSIELVKERLTKVIEDRDRVISTLTREIELQQKIIEQRLK